MRSKSGVWFGQWESVFWKDGWEDSSFLWSGVIYVKLK
jgi:hypothetical protein